MSKQWTIGGQDARDRLMGSIERRRQTWFPDDPALTETQVAVVLHALADHTAIMQALNYSVDVDSPWPQATSFGRWFHDLGDYMEGEQ